MTAFWCGVDTDSQKLLFRCADFGRGTGGHTHEQKNNNFSAFVCKKKMYFFGQVVLYAPDGSMLIAASDQTIYTFASRPASQFLVAPLVLTPSFVLEVKSLNKIIGDSLLPCSSRI